MTHNEIIQAAYLKGFEPSSESLSKEDIYIQAVEFLSGEKDSYYWEARMTSAAKIAAKAWAEADEEIKKTKTITLCQQLTI